MDIAASRQTEAAGDAALWQTYGNRVYRYLLSLTGQRETAEDLTQETFLLAIRDLRRGRAVEHEAAWIFRIATNLARDLFRRRRLISWIPFLPERHDSRVGDHAEALAEQDLLLRALAKLPKEVAAMLLLKDGEGFTTREIAALTGSDYEAVRKRLARARLLVREEYRRLRGGDQ